MNKNDIIIKLLVKEVKNNKELYKSFDFSNKLQKYDIKLYLTDILYVLKTGVSWRDLRSNICWNSIYKVYIKLNKHKIFEYSFKELLKKYLKKLYKNKLKYISTDTTFIPNKKGHDKKGYNKFYNKKNGTKISMHTDLNGIPLNIKCYKGNMNDSKILCDHLKDGIIVNHDHLLKDYNSYFLGDKGYDTKNVRSKLKEFKLKILIDQNKRNIKDPEKLIKFNKIEKGIYKKRLVIERTFNKLKYNRKLCLRYENKIENFIGFIYLGMLKLFH